MPKRKKKYNIDRESCFYGNSKNYVCETSAHNPKNPNYQKNLAKDRREYKHVPKSQDKRGRPKLYTKEQAKERQKKRDMNRVQKPKKYKRKIKPILKPQGKKIIKPITLSFD